MKSEDMIMAWDQALPSDDAKARMLGEILRFRNEYAKKARPVPAEKSSDRLEDGASVAKARPALAKRYALIAAACALAVFVLCVGAVQAGILKKAYKFDLPNGQVVAFRPGSYAGADAMYAYNDAVVQRAISDEEWQALFPTLSGILDGFAIFKVDTGELLHFEGWVASEERYFTNDAGVTMRVVGGVGRLQVLASKSGLPVSDTVISGNESMTEINGVPVKTGYSTSKPNSKGSRTVIFFAEFEQNDATIFLSFSGDAKESKQVGEHLSEIVYIMITNGAPDLTSVTY
jgi:hypothetical protein